MKKIKFLLLACVMLCSVTSCFEDQDDNAIVTTDINDFVWKAMNAYYLYNSNIPDLSNERFGINGIENRYDKTAEYSDYLNSFSTPEEIFDPLVFEPLDPFSAIVPNYLDVVNQQQGISISNGIEFRIYLVPGSETELFGAITLVLNNSNADNLGVQRGQIFRAVDNQELTTSNANQLLGQTSYILNFADYDDNGTSEAIDDTITLNGESVSLTKEAYTENPVHIAEVLDLINLDVGYLMYNGFTGNSTDALNNAFALFQSSGITELVIDLRYNGGGVLQTAVDLASMVTGQFNEQVFSKLIYNTNQEAQNRDFNFRSTLENGTSINSLNLNKVYILTTSASASASELLINSLRPYINVVHIGDVTSGKTQANRLVLDSPDFGGSGINPSHTYALIPLIANSINVNDELVPATGLVPNIQIVESPSTFGTLGNITEPLLAEALADIISGDRFNGATNEQPVLREIKIVTQKNKYENLMFVD